MDNKPGTTVSRIPANANVPPNRFVSATGNLDEIHKSGANAAGLGVLLAAPDSRLPVGYNAAGAQRLEVAVGGIVLVDAAAAINDGQYVVSDANGKAIPDPVTGGATSFVRGIAVGAVSSGDVTAGIQIAVDIGKAFRAKN